MLIYGGGSIKKNGIYDEIIKILTTQEKEVFEDAGVMPNPTIEKLYEGCNVAKENKIDFILAVGGGSVIMRKQYRYPLIVMKIHGRNII